MPKKILLITISIFIFGCSSKGQKNNSQQINKFLNLAFFADSSKNFIKSIEYYSEILKIDSNNLTALTNRGRAYLWIGQSKEGFLDYNKAIKLYPLEKTYFTRGMAYIKINSFENAIEDFKKSIELNYQYSEPYYGLSLIKANQDSIEIALNLCKKADEINYISQFSTQIHYIVCEKNNDYKSMIVVLTEAIKFDPINPGFYNNRGIAKNQLENYEEAISDFDTAIKLDSKMAFAYNNKALSLLKLKAYKEAMICVNTS